METKNSLSCQIEQLKLFLLMNGYTPKSVHFYRHCWSKLLLYAEETGYGAFSKQLGINFLRDAYGVTDAEHPDGKRKKPTRAVKLLTSYLETGRIASYLKRDSDIPEQYAGIYGQYVEHLNFLGQRLKSIKTKKSRVRQFLLYLNVKSICSIQQIRKKDLIGFMTFLKSRYSSAGRGNILYTIKDFLMFCVSAGLIPEDMPKLIKGIYTNPNETLPSVYSSDEVRRILESVDKSTPDGKKDYAILILAAVLGIRASDIIHMQMNNIKWNRNVIEFHQRKTDTFVQLPLPMNVQYALVDYLENSRPDTEHPNVFVRSREPIAPYADAATIFSIVSKHINLAGIPTNGRNHGSHSLRHSMASSMFENEEPLPVIASALGHCNTKNTSRYLRIDINRLRSVALEVPE